MSYEQSSDFLRGTMVGSVALFFIVTLFAISSAFAAGERNSFDPFDSESIGERENL